MLVLSRKEGESLVIGDDVEIKFLGVVNGVVRVGIVAPKEITVHRKEVYNRIKKEQARI